jgi:hypothetical protein
MTTHILVDVKKNKALGTYHSEAKAVEALKSLYGMDLVWNGTGYVHKATNLEYKIVPVPTVSTESFLNGPPLKPNR